MRGTQGEVLSDDVSPGPAARSGPGGEARVRHRAGVLGSPVAHSLSPVLHTAAYRALGLTDWRYSSARVDAAGFRAHLAGLDDTWRGLSLTMPLKEVAFEVAARVSPVAAATGAVNTLVRGGDGWSADNTDVTGMVRALAEAGVGTASSALVIGSGATARSAVAALARMGATRVTFMVRGAARPATLRQARSAGLDASEVSLGDWPANLDLVVSTVPVEASDPLAAGLPSRGRALLDVVYGGGPGALSAAATHRGYAVVPGTAMLLHQAAEQVVLMTGLSAPLEAMRGALADALAGRGGP